MTTMAKRKKLLITGAAGRVGRGVAEMLANDYDLILTDKSPGKIGDLKIQQMDLLDQSQVEEKMQGVDAVVHLAIASMRFLGHLSVDDYEDEVMRVNCMGTQHLYKAAYRANVPRFVYFSSLTVMLGWSSLNRRSRLSPEMPISLRDLYATTKHFGEVMGQCYAEQTDMSVIAIRMGQPWPVKIGRHEKYHLRLNNPRHRGVMVGYKDIAQMTRCAIEAKDVKFKVVNLVSESSHRDIDLTGAMELGYQPTQYIVGQPVVDYDDRPR